jgi:hypothetical protein
MDFSTPCCARTPERLLRAALACLLALVALWALPAAVRAQEHGKIVAMRLERAPEGLFLSATMQLELPSLVEDALYKGISMYFVAEAEVLRPRWYWYDKTVAHTTRYLRLSYQPLTRRWRLTQSSAPFSASGLGVSLGQNFDDVSDALSAMQRIARWKIAEAGALNDDAPYQVDFQFRLDLSQLPRPMQFDAVGRSDWSMLLKRSMHAPERQSALPTTPEPTPEAAAEPAP